MESNDETEVEQIRISLILAKGCSDASLKVPADPIAVPSTTRKRGLSAIVNHLLDRKVISDGASSHSDEDSDNDEDKLPSIPFDFLINKKLLRLSIEGAARRDGLSLEQAVEIQYFPARLAPESDGESEILPDWISAMSYSQNMLYSGSCDGSIRMFHNNDKNEKGSFTQESVIKAHSGSVKCISSLGCANNLSMVASGSMDQTLVSHIHDKGNKKLSLHAVYSGGHTSSINSVALASINGSVKMASGDWDGGLCIWKVPQSGEIDESGESSTHKRKKQKGSSKDITNDVKEVSPTSYFKAHKSNISGIVLGHEQFDKNNSTLFTSSWDHSIKAWDVESQNEILALNGSKVVTSFGRCHNSDVVATGHPDCCVRLWDMRTSNGGDGNLFDGSLRPRYVFICPFVISISEY
jgi:ribosome biogenesis protein YTM1